MRYIADDADATLFSFEGKDFESETLSLEIVADVLRNQDATGDVLRRRSN